MTASGFEPGAQILNTMNRLHHALRHAIDAQLNVVTAGNPAVAGSHFLFLLGQFAIAAIGLTALPIWLAVDPTGAPIAALVALWILAPLGTAVFVLRTGRLRQGQMTATVALTCLVIWLCTTTGGLVSPLIFLFAIVPLVALLSATPSAVSHATMVSFAGLGLCACVSIVGLNGGSTDWLASVQAAVFALLTIGLTGALAARHLSVQRGTTAPVVGNVSLNAAGDLITLHHENGDVASASPIVNELLGFAPEQLHGRGMAALVHIEDRSRFDTALHRASTGAIDVRLAYRMRTETDDRAGAIWVETTFRRANTTTTSSATVVGVTRDASHRRQEDQTDQKTSHLLDGPLDADLRASVDAIVCLSDRLADPRLTVGGEEWSNYARLIHTSSTQLAATLSEVGSSAEDVDADPSSGGSGIVAIIRSAIDLAFSRDTKCLVEPTVESASVSVGMPQSDCLRVLVDVLLVAKHHLSGENGLIVAVDLFETSVRLRIGASVAQPFVQLKSTYLRRASVVHFGLDESAAIVANSGGKLTVDMHSRGGAAISLVLPASAAQQGGSGDVGWPRRAGVQKSA